MRVVLGLGLREDKPGAVWSRGWLDIVREVGKSVWRWEGRSAVRDVVLKLELLVTVDLKMVMLPSRLGFGVDLSRVTIRILRRSRRSRKLPVGGVEVEAQLINQKRTSVAPL